MTAQYSSWTPETERSFKEVLYRFMGEVHATKAALYLKSRVRIGRSQHSTASAAETDWRRSFADDHPLVRMVRAFGKDPVTTTIPVKSVNSRVISPKRETPD